MSYRVHTLNVDANNEVNDEYTTRDVLTLSDKPTVDEVRRELIRLERMADDWPADDVTLQEDGDEIFVCYKDGRKGYKLVPDGR